MRALVPRAGMLNDALVVANMALEISPKFVVLHFTMANIYASKVRHFELSSVRLGKTTTNSDS